MESVAIDEEWRVCFSELASGLLLFARQWVRSPADAEDVVQEAFVRFWRRNRRISNQARLYATVRSIALDFIRRNSRRARRESTAVSDMEQSIQPQFAAENEFQEALAVAIEHLPSEQREVLVMKIWNSSRFPRLAACSAFRKTVPRRAIATHLAL
jgi:RNA polymerase sigma-70 factor, ECF subfamily